MNKKDYETAMASLYDRNRDLNFFQDRLLNRTLCFTSANLRNFMPEIPYGEHENMLRKILLNKERCVLDGLYEDILSEVIIENLNDENLTYLKTRPTVICTYHLGSMYIINNFLSYHRIEADIILSKSTLQEMKNTFALMQEVHNDRYGGINLSYIEADASISAYKILRSLRKGRSAIIYIDGNIGVGRNNKLNDHYCNIEFLNGRLLVRQGAAWIANKVNVPIVGIITYRDDQQNIHMNFSNPIFPNLGSEIATPRVVMQKLFSHLEFFVRKYYDQWECWIYLHNSMDLSSFSNVEYRKLKTEMKPDISYRFNHRDYGLFSIDTDYFLLSKVTYQVYKLPESSYMLLRSVARQPFSGKKFARSYLETLHNKGVFIKEN